MNAGQSQLPLLPTFQAITAGTPANPSSPIGFDIRILRYHVQWAVPTFVVAVVMAYLAWLGYRAYRRRTLLTR